MDYSVGESLRVDGTVYDIIGKIQYRNEKDNCCWYEYRMRSRGSGKEKWLSYDSAYGEYSISEATWNISTSGYHLVDEGEEVVIGAWGDVDVDIGERARFKEYEDSTEEKILSSEIWDDGEELSVGYYLDLDEINIYSDTSSYDSGGFGGNSFVSDNPVGNFKKMSSPERNSKLIAVGIVVLYLVLSFFSRSNINLNGNSIAKYLKKTSWYSYVTSITGNENKDADVYKSGLSDIDSTVKDILDGIDGDTEDVQQNNEDGDNSVAILTDKEYCLVYLSEENEILVQVSSRKYAYTTDKQPYHSRRNTHRYFRRYYYSRGYYQDAGSYGKYYSPYSSFDDTTVGSNMTDMYNSYSSSVRQSSVGSRTSSGGGLSSGK